MYLTNNIEERFQSEVKLAYQQEMSRLEKYVTLKQVENADTTYFNTSTAGGEMQKKGKFGNIPKIGGGTDRVKCELETFYGKEDVPSEDVENTTMDGMLVISTNVNAARERKKDSIIKTALAASTNTYDTDGAAGLTTDKVDYIWQTHFDNLIFENGEVPVNLVSSKQWNELAAIESFNDADKVGSEDLPLIRSKAQSGRFWRDMIWVANPNLAISNDVRTCFSFVPSSVGVAMSNSVLKSVVKYDEDTDSYIYWAKIKLGGCMIDSTGCIKFGCDESAST